ncbi:hypothetical protein HZA57_10150 [Candidatus Poribacteria bacterium]|nr:hypothetical protein [Candidatus Poribacteria bacterium]
MHPFRMKRTSPALALSLALAGFAAAQNTSFDESLVFVDNFGNAWQLSSTSDSLVGTTGVDNPSLSLEVGKRYKGTYTAPLVHPFVLMAKGTSAGGDSALLVQGSGTGSLEGDATIDWFNSGSDFYFNLSPTLADAMNGTASQNPGYRCNVHTTTMRGDITFRAVATGLIWGTSETESFENAANGTSVNQAFASWSIVTDDPANYTATISTSPSGHTNQAAGSTRWLTITDNHNAAGVQDRTYSPPIAPPSGMDVVEYTMSWRADVQATVAGTAALAIVQHFETGSGSFKNVGGIEFTNSGANAIVIGTDNSGIGKAGATDRMTLYNYGDAGGFAQNTWVPVSFTLDFRTGELTASATGTDGSTNVSQTLTTLSLQGGEINNFRFCIRGTDTGNTSTISYDNLSLAGTAAPASLQSWQVY